MTATESWLLAAAIVAALGALLHLVGPAVAPRTVGPGLLNPLACAFTSAAISLIAVALLVAP